MSHKCVTIQKQVVAYYIINTVQITIFSKPLMLFNKHIKLMEKVIWWDTDKALTDIHNDCPSTAEGNHLSKSKTFRHVPLGLVFDESLR